MSLALQRHLEELAEFLGELLHQDPNGEVTMLDVTPGRVTNFKKRLNDTINMANTLNMTLEGEFRILFIATFSALFGIWNIVFRHIYAILWIICD